MFGPIFLIVIGIAFMLANMGMVSWHDLFRWFALYWPALIILWGVLKLVEYMQAKNSGEPYRGVGGGSIVLLVFIILFGSGLTGSYRFTNNGNWKKIAENMNIDEEQWGGMFGTKFSYNSTLDHEFPASSSVRVSVDRGEVRITASTDNKVHVISKETVYAASQAEADKQRANITPQIRVESNVLVVETLPRGDASGAKVEIEVQCPRKADVDINVLHGGLNVTGRDGSVKFINNRGDVIIDDVNGNVRAQMKSGDFSVNKIKGEVSLEGRANEVKVTDVTGLVIVNGEYYGDITMGKLAKGMRFKSSRSDLSIEKLDGDFSMSSGELRANNMGGPVRMTTRSKDIHLEDVSGAINIEDSHSEVQVHPKAPYGTVDINNKNGDIVFNVPSGAGYTVEARVNQGELDDEFNLKSSEAGREKRVSGDIGKGGPTVHLNTEHSTITIRKH